METKAEVWIPLTKGKVTVVDFEDFERLRRFKWHALRGKEGIWYASRTEHSALGTKKAILLHRFLMDASPGTVVDHKDRDGLNNRRQSNLRFATRSQNGQNQRKHKGASQYKGVSWNSKTSQWAGQLVVDKKSIWLGYFQGEEAAARAYDAAALKYFGEFALLNFPDQNQCQFLINAGGAA